MIIRVDKLMMTKTGYKKLIWRTLILIVVIVVTLETVTLNSKYAYNEKIENGYSAIHTLHGLRQLKFNSTLGSKQIMLKLPTCPLLGKLEGSITIDTADVSNYTLLEERLVKSRVRLGGQWQPDDCQPLQNIAIIVPFRDRLEHLKIFIRHIHPFLQKQKLKYTIFIIEQDQKYQFNRGSLLNTGFLEASKLGKFDCFYFHDVDSLPANDRIRYSCPDYPRHLAASVQKFRYRLPYDTYTGGVFGIRADQFLLVNGFSNVYFGWGAEDDDFWMRLQAKKMPVQRFLGSFSAYCSLPHSQQEASFERKYLLKFAAYRADRDGLNSIKYSINDIKLEKLYTLVQVSFEKEKLRQNVTHQHMTIEAYLQLENTRKKKSESFHNFSNPTVTQKVLGLYDYY